ncbi:hypothetical protein B14911_26645 [Bacillus sp. NRRL B-14911]|nr:hypothetical protein B14911_26645 [Bacillus sp. NRRL B-14911]
MCREVTELVFLRLAAFRLIIIIPALKKAGLFVED